MLQVVNKPKHVLEAWFKELAGNKPLLQLAKKLPIFNKKEDIFLTLCEHNISMLRAAWFIKMTNAYNTAIAEARVRGRKMFDPFTGWYHTIFPLTVNMQVTTIDAPRYLQHSGRGCRVGKVRASTTFPMPDHKGFKLQQLSEIDPLHF